MPVDESLASLPFYNLTTAELIGDLLYTSITVKESYCQNPSFYNDICSASNNSILQELQFRYSTDDEFNDLVKKTASSLELSIFHINIRSLNKNHRRLIYFLQSLDITFDVIVLSEIWNYNLDFYHNIFSDYCFYGYSYIYTSIFKSWWRWHLCQKQFFLYTTAQPTYWV